MVSMTSSLPEIRSGPFTRADLDTMPDDGRRYEIVDGVLIVSPSPLTRHQVASFELGYLLRSHIPDGLTILAAPLDVAIADDTVIQPDLVVARSADFGRRGLDGVLPLLVVEVLSPRTRQHDLVVKKARLERAGCPSYWVLDPDEPSITVWELQAGEYVEAAHAAADEVCSVSLPFPAEITPAALVLPAGRRP